MKVQLLPTCRGRGCGSGPPALDVSETWAVLAPFTVHLFCQGRSRKGKGKRHASSPTSGCGDYGAQEVLSFLGFYRRQVSTFTH